MFLFVRGRICKYTPTTLRAGDTIIYDVKNHSLTARRPPNKILLWHDPCSATEKFKIPFPPDPTCVRFAIELIASSLHLSFREKTSAEGKQIFVLID